MIITVSDSFGAIEASALITSEGGRIADSARPQAPDPPRVSVHRSSDQAHLREAI